MLWTLFVSGEKLPWKYYDDNHADFLLWFDAFSNFFLKSLFVLGFSANHLNFLNFHRQIYP